MICNETILLIFFFIRKFLLVKMVRYDLYTIKNNVYNGTKKNDITPGGGVRKFFNILQNIYIHLKKYCLHIIQNTFFS